MARNGWKWLEMPHTSPFSHGVVPILPITSSWIDHLPCSKGLSELPSSQLVASVVAAACLGHALQGFWQQAHGALLGRRLSPRHVVDVYLTLCTHQMCPVTLLEEKGRKGDLKGLWG